MSGLNNDEAKIQEIFPNIVADISIKDLSLDSLSLVMLAIDLEENFDLVMPKDFWNFSIREIVSHGSK